MEVNSCPRGNGHSHSEYNLKTKIKNTRELNELSHNVF